MGENMSFVDIEESIQEAIQLYLKDSSPENYWRLKVLVLGESRQECNLFQEVCNFLNTRSRFEAAMR
jgi:hypothetical protein